MQRRNLPNSMVWSMRRPRCWNTAPRFLPWKLLYSFLNSAIRIVGALRFSFFCCFPLSIYGDFSLILSYTVPISICELPLCFSLALVWFCRLGAHVHLPIAMLSTSLKPTKLLGHVPVLFPNSSVSWVSICGFGSGVSVGWVAKLAWLQSMSKGVERFCFLICVRAS